MTRIIDAHLHYHDDPHFEKIARAAGHENNEAHLRQVYQAHNIKRGVVMGNRDPSVFQQGYPDFLSYCVGLDSSYFKGDNVARSVDLVREHLRRENCVGIKLYPGYNPHYVSDPIYHPYYELAQEAGKPVAIHTGATASPKANLKYSHPLTLDEVATAFPGVQFIMCHLGNPWVVDAAAVLSKNRNVAADLSGILEGLVDIPTLLEENRGYVEHLKTWIGYLGDYSKLMYGTDWPLANIPAYIEFVAHLIPQRHHDAVFFGNANRIYGLGL